MNPNVYVGIIHHMNGIVKPSRKVLYKNNTLEVLPSIKWSGLEELNLSVYGGRLSRTHRIRWILYDYIVFVKRFIDQLEADIFLLPVPKLGNKGHRKIMFLVKHGLF